jgi:hypothetical protein
VRESQPSSPGGPGDALARVEQVLSGAQHADDLLRIVAGAPHGASTGPVWPVGELSYGLAQAPGPTSIASR